jgi:hypothetical protein
MGQRSPSEGYNGSSNNVVNIGENGVGRTWVIFDIVDTALSEERNVMDITKLTSMSDVVGIPNTKDNGGVWMVNIGVSSSSSSSSSLDGRIALGEEQMMRSGTMNNTTVMAATVMNSNHILDEMQQQQLQQQPKQIAKKPFLRKGTRKEPSALHIFATTATATATVMRRIRTILDVNYPMVFRIKTQTLGGRYTTIKLNEVDAFIEDGAVRGDTILNH